MMVIIINKAVEIFALLYKKADVHRIFCSIGMAVKKKATGNSYIPFRCTGFVHTEKLSWEPSRSFYPVLTYDWNV